MGLFFAYLICDDLGLDNDDKINILKSNFNKRVETEEQLWNSNDLFTKKIKEDVKVYPEARLAYTEITMDIVGGEKKRKIKKIFTLSPCESFCGNFSFFMGKRSGTQRHFNY